VSESQGRRQTTVDDEMVERAAYILFVGFAKAPWTSYEADDRLDVEPITQNECRNIARAALRAALEDR
jgi:hypothetical protein